MTHKTPAEVFPPGEYIRDEIEARGWTQQDLANIIKRPLPAVNQIITGHRAITPETAKVLGDAFSTSAEMWMNLESAYQLWKVTNSDPDVPRRARLYEYAPITEMQRRGWISTSASIEVLEAEVLRFFSVQSFEERRQLKVAARKATSYANASPTEAAWFARVSQLARTITTKPFDHAAFVQNFPRIRDIAAEPQSIRRIPSLLADWGIKFVVVEPLQKTRIDGAAVWLNDNEPAVAISMRFDRVDSFWFVLLHELIHVKHKDKDVLDVDLVADSKGQGNKKEESPTEVRTNREASELLIPRQAIIDFVGKVAPLFSKKKIADFAHRVGVHPGIVVGQLQHRKAIPFSHSREMLLQGQIVKILAESALVDGWGSTPISA